MFVRHAPLRRLRGTAAAVSATRPRSTGIVGPLALAVGLAVAGAQLDALAPAAPVVRTGAVGTYEPVLPERVAPEAAPARATRVRGNVVARTVPAKPAKTARAVKKRASRSAARTAAAPRAGWVRPANGPRTSGFGFRWGRMHKGVDIGASYGSPIYAAASGVVTFAGAQGGYGRLVTIRHADGTETAYGHMSATYVRYGQRVAAGERIAAVGSEGRSTGPHLHFEVRVHGVAINPLPFMRARGVFL
jgi:murein DD-endopeptidase MepM/ murein hydrolase activator NlpD